MRRQNIWQTARHSITKKRVYITIIWLCWGLLLCLAFSNANRLAAVYPSTSLRYDSPISHAAATKARRMAAAEGDAASFWPTFWTEQEGVAAQGLHTVTARCLWFSGDAVLVRPADYLLGSYPAPLDNTGCCISDTLAWQLWGTEDVVGYEISIAKQSYTVRGVFREDDLLVMAGVGETAFADGWQAVELAGMPDGDARAAALAFAVRAG